MTDPIPDNPEFFPTPAWVVHRLLEFCSFPFATAWLEPCVGNGDIVRAVNDYYRGLGFEAPRWVTQDIRPTGAAMHVGDYTKRQPPGTFATSITNPPFSKAMQIARAMMDQCRHVAILQRLDWAATEERHQFFQDTTPNIFIVPEKISFVNGTTDLRHYAWFLWCAGRGHGRVHWLNRTPVAERKGSPTTQSRQMGMF